MEEITIIDINNFLTMILYIILIVGLTITFILTSVVLYKVYKLTNLLKNTAEKGQHIVELKDEVAEYAQNYVAYQSNKVLLGLVDRFLVALKKI